MYVAAALLLAWLTVRDCRQQSDARRGIEDGLAGDGPALSVPRFGTNVSLEIYPDEVSLRRSLVRAREAGLGTLRQRFSWADIEPYPGQYRWELWDARLALVAEEGLGLVAVLEGPPAWARSPSESSDPYGLPRDMAEYARFCAAFAEHYGRLVTAYQIWDEPNVSPHWGRGEVSPAGYVEMLAAASTAIRHVLPEARIIAGGLAPNVEPGGRNQSDVHFLREIYRRGAGAYFDILGVKSYGFWTGADDRRVTPGVLNLSRVVLLREEMVRRGDGRKPIWALEGGWCALPSNWPGRPSPQGSDSQWVQSGRLQRGLQRVQREWPWLGLVLWQHLQPAVDDSLQSRTDDPARGYALLDISGSPTSLYYAMSAQAAGEAALYPGRNATLGASLQPRGQYGVRLAFYGTDLVLDLDPGTIGAGCRFSLDEGELRTATISQTAQQRGLSAAHGLRPGVHYLWWDADRVPAQLIRGARVGNRLSWWGLWRTAMAGALGVAACAWAASRAGRSVPFRSLWSRLSAQWLGMPVVLQAAPFVIFCAVAALTPQQPLRLATLALVALAAALRPDIALGAAVACIPLAPLHVQLGPGAFSLLEISTLLALGGALARWALLPAARFRPLVRTWHEVARWSLADWLVLSLVALGLVSSLLAEYQRVALREWRLVIVGPALLYAMVRSAGRGRAIRLHEVLWVAGLGLALYALWMYPRSTGVIEAEGVRRARAYFGSPNNLALLLERVLPVGLATLLWSTSRRRRCLYGVGSVLMALTVALTFSRGAWLLGVPAGLLTVVVLSRPPAAAPATSSTTSRALRARVVWTIVGAVVGGIAVLIALAGTQRIVSLLNLTRGTTFLRVSLWQAAWDMAKEHPLLGVGLDNFLYYYGDYVRPGAEVERFLSHPHNILLDFWLRLGLPGLVWLCAAVFVCIRQARAALARPAHREVKAQTVGLLGGLVAMMMHGMVDSSFFVMELGYWFLLALAYLDSSFRWQESDDMQGTQQSPQGPTL